MNNQALGLRNPDLLNDDPFDIFARTLTLAEQSEPNDASAMALASVDEDGMPNVRVVLMRRFDQRGFCFFTNMQSPKGEELLGQKKAAANFHWKSLRKQVRIRGMVEPVSPEEADEYFNSRPRGSQLASSVSEQSRPLPVRQVFDDAIAELDGKFDGKDVPRPDHWAGFRIMPLSIEFWDDGEYRTHDRLRFDRETLDGPWQTSYLYP